MVIVWLLLVLVRIEFGFKVFRRCLGEKGASYRHFIGKTAIDAINIEITIMEAVASKPVQTVL